MAAVWREQISLFFPLALDTHYISLNIARDRIQETRTWREGSDPPPPPACVRTRTLEPSFIHAKCAADVYTVRMMISVSRKLVA